MRSVIALAVTLAAGGSAVRSIYLNGTDISSARSQELKGVDVMINEKGDVFIVAPQYQVSEEDTYVPLSKYVQGLNGPKHQPMQPVQKVQPEPPKAMAKEDVAPEAAPGAPIPKAGMPVVGQAHPVELVPQAPQGAVGNPGEAPPKSEAVKAEADQGSKEP